MPQVQAILAMMNFAPFCIGYSPDVAALLKLGKTACKAEVGGCSNTEQKKLQDEEDDRWLQVEGGSPLNVRWRSCPGCCFLNSPGRGDCKACGIKAVSSKDESYFQPDDSDEPMPDEAVADVQPICQMSSLRESAQMSSLRGAGINRKLSIEVSVADDAAGPRQSCDGISTVSRHNVIAAVFNALSRRCSNFLSPIDLEKFCDIAGLSNGCDDTAWAQDYQDVASEYGWDASKGAHLGQFLRCIDHFDGKWYCPTEVLWTLLARIDKQEESLAQLDGEDHDSHILAAIARGHAPLDIDLSTGRPTGEGGAARG